jgi:LacI family transcriptional regulator
LTIFRQLLHFGEWWEGPMATNAWRKRSARFIEIAAEAGVSPSTVDRVLNARGSASQTAREKVIAAAQKLGVPRILPSVAHELVHLDILLPDNKTPFFQRLRSALARGSSILDKRIVVHRSIVPESDQASLLRAISQPAYRRRGLIVAAPDTLKVRQALKDVLAHGEAVVTVVSNVADVPGIAYFGIDNYRAGRTAGFVMGRFSRRPGRVIFLSGRNDFAAHQERAAGCREALIASFPELRCDAAPFETLDDDYRCYVAVADAIRSTEVAGVYNSGAGSAGINEALGKFDPDRRITWITHELSDDHRCYLASGALAMVIDQDPDRQAFLALRYLVEQIGADRADAATDSHCEFRLYFAENATQDPYLTTGDPHGDSGARTRRGRRG